MFAARSRLGGLTLAVVLTAGAVEAAPPRADDKAACADSYEGAQRHRSEGKLSLARAELEVCARVCPGTLLGDCQRWGAEVDALIPKLEIVARDSRGKPVERVTVTSAGRVLARDSEIRAVRLDPGDYELEIAREDGARVTKKVSLHAGERRTLDVEFPAIGPGEAEEPKPIPRPIDRDESPASEAKSPPIGAWVLGGIGVVGLATGAALGIHGHVKASDYRSSCKPNCNSDDVDRIRTEWWIGGIAAGVGAISLGAAILIWQSDKGERTGGLTIEVGARQSAIGWRGNF